MKEISIDVTGLTKYYGDIVAVDNVSFNIENGIFGLLGPNGAGKSTIVLMLTTLLKPSSGTAYICGHSIIEEANKVRECISYVPQDLAVDDKLTGRENVLLYARLYGINNPKDKTDEVLSLLELSNKADMCTNTYSGGMKRRLELAQALVHEPRVLFFDEPTVGLDVASRTRIWSHLKKLAENDVTILITTHYMEEADMFCDRVAIIDNGQIKLIDSPANLKKAISKSIVTIKLFNTKPFIIDFYHHIDGIVMLDSEKCEIRFMVDNGEEAIPFLVEILGKNGIRIKSISVQKPSLNDVFMKSVDMREKEWSKVESLRFKRLMKRMR